MSLRTNLYDTNLPPPWVRLPDGTYRSKSGRVYRVISEEELPAYLAATPEDERNTVLNSDTYGYAYVVPVS